jgi:hypothetical protein
MKRRWQLWLGLTILLLAGGFFLLPAVRWSVIGWASGEAFYQGRPTSYWSQEAQNLNSLVVTVGGSVERHWVHNIWMRRLSWEEEVLEKLKLRTMNLESNDFPLLNPDPTALPVLIELLDDPDSQVRQIAAQGLERLGPEAAPAITALRLACEEEDAKVRQQARLALWSVDRERRP